MPVQDPSILFRDNADIMDIRRLGALHQTRLSFARSFIRRMFKHQWRISIHKWSLNRQGFGTVIYRLQTPQQIYELVVFANKIKDEERNDRVIAEKWDVTCAFISGTSDDSFIEQLRRNVPLQEAGRNNPRVLVLFRANKSVRVFEHTLQALSQGKQPDLDELAKVGYLLRTTAVYGNGKFGIADFANLREDQDFHLSFCAQMCAVYMLRQFSFDWIDCLAQEKGGGKASSLHPQLKRYLGIGNATGLGMSLFLLRHPRIVDNWLYQRELALSQVCREKVSEEKNQQVIALLTRAQKHLTEVVTIDDQQRALNHRASEEIGLMIDDLEHHFHEGHRFSDVISHHQKYSFEGQEVAISCILEVFPDIVDPYEEYMNTEETTFSLAGVTIAELKQLLIDKYTWVKNIDFEDPKENYWFWYISEDKEEPRIGVRYQDQGWEIELPLDIAKQIHRLDQRLLSEENSKEVPDFLLENPDLSMITRRVWTLGNCPLGEIRANVIGKQFLPMHLLRCKLALFGATKFDPRSDKWVRVTFFQNAPLIDEGDNDDWLFPIKPSL